MSRRAAPTAAAEAGYVGWEPSDLQPHARLFHNEPRPEEYVGWEPSDLKPHARQFKARPTPPPLPEPERNPPCMRSLVNDSFKPLPGNEYKQQDEAKKGPLSKTVTLTNPFNPFNKLQYYVLTGPPTPSPRPSRS